MAADTSDESKLRMAASLGGAGDKSKEAPNPGGTHVLPPGEVPSLDDPKVDPSKTVKTETPFAVSEGLASGNEPPIDEDDVSEHGDGHDTDDDRDDASHGGSGDEGGSGGNEPPAPPSGGDGGKGDDDGKKPSRAQGEVIELLKQALVHVGAFGAGSDHIRESDKTVVDLTNALRLATAGPMTDDDYDTIKKLLVGLLGPLEGMANTLKEVAGRGNNAKAHELLKKLGFRQ